MAWHVTARHGLAIAFALSAMSAAGPGAQRGARRASPTTGGKCAWRALPPMPAALFGHFIWNQPPGAVHSGRFAGAGSSGLRHRILAIDRRRQVFHAGLELQRQEL